MCSKTDDSQSPAALHRLSQVATLFIVVEAKTSIVQGFFFPIHKVWNYFLFVGWVTIIIIIIITIITISTFIIQQKYQQ
jgi:hypothetical protein